MKLFIFAVICVLHVANATPTPTPTARPTPPGTPTEHPEHRDLPRLDITDENTDVIGSFDLGYDLIMGKVVTREPAEKTIEETVTFPWEGMVDQHVVVRCVKHMDYNGDRKTEVKVIGGGIGKSFIKLRVRSKAGNGIRSSLRFYAHKLNETSIVQHSMDNEIVFESIFSRIGSWFSKVWEKIYDGIRKVFTKSN